MTDLQGHVALVTGATSGLGRHFAQLIANAGASVVIAGRRRDRLETLKAQIAAEGGRCASIVLDVTDAAQIPRAIDAAEHALGPVNILINNAGMSVNGPVAEIATADFDAVLATNLRAPFLMAQEVARRLIAGKRSGAIVNISSITAFRVAPGSAPYCMSKAGLSMMTQCLAREWARYDITVNALCPGYIETELNDAWFRSEKGQAQINGFPKRRLQKASDLDAMLLLLLSNEGRAITGSLLTVDEGQSL